MEIFKYLYKKHIFSECGYVVDENINDHNINIDSLSTKY